MQATAARLYLASASPRRRELLTQLGIAHRQFAVEVDESPLSGEAPEVYVERLALAKARTGQQALGTRPPLPVLGSDTAVVVGERILGKPRDRAHALEMLALLSGREHRVLSAVALVEGQREAVRVQASRVWFREIPFPEAERYWASGEPSDKAGAYAIQGRGAAFVARLDGSYSGVMGLPLFETAQLLEAFGIDL